MPTEMIKLRSLGALERYMTTRGDLGIYNNVAVTGTYRRQQIVDLKTLVFGALAIVVPQHPVLSAIPMDTDTNSPYFARLPLIDLRKVVNFVDLSQYGDCHDSSAIDAFLEEQHNHPFEHTTPLTPFWRLHVFEDISDASHFTISFCFHHCIADTKSAVVFHEALETALSVAHGLDSKPSIQSPNIPLLPPVDQFLAATLSRKQHQIEFGQLAGGRVPSNSHPQRPDFAHTGYQPMLVAEMFRLLPHEYTSIDADCAVSLRPWLPYPIDAKSIGCFVDNFCTFYHRKPFSWADAHRTKQSIDQVLQQKGGENLCSKISQVSDLRSWFEKKLGQARSSALELSNVGKLTTATGSMNYEIETLIFSQSAGACSGAIKVSAATGRDSRLILGFSWQEGIVDDTLVEGLIIALDPMFRRLLMDHDALN